VIFFYDGTNLFFQPDPFISQPVTYQIGPGQHWTTVDQAMAVLTRKAISSTGYVTFQLAQAVFNPFSINHPSADRITIKGTMIGPAPQWTEFANSGSDPSSLARDAANNLTMLRTRYGTEIRLTTSSGAVGFSNQGPGAPTLQDVLITGQQLTPNPPGGDFKQAGVQVPLGKSVTCYNVAVWGTVVGWFIDGTCFANSCSCSGVTLVGFHVTNYLSATATWVFGPYYYGYEIYGGELNCNSCITYHAGNIGLRSIDGAGLYFVASWSLGSANIDEYAVGGAMIANVGSQFNSSSPFCPPGGGSGVGNGNATVTAGPYPTQN
jgi:hypothetical protein